MSASLSIYMCLLNHVLYSTCVLQLVPVKSSIARKSPSNTRMRINSSLKVDIYYLRADISIVPTLSITKQLPNQAICSTLKVLSLQFFTLSFLLIHKQMQRWLLCFQKSVALVLSKLLLSSSQSFPDSKLAIAKYNLDHQQQIEYRMSGTGTATATANMSTAACIKNNTAERVTSEKVMKCTDIRSIMRLNSDIVHQKISHHNTSHGTKKDTDKGKGNNDNINNSSREKEDKWLSELGHGHGKHSSLALKRNYSQESDTITIHPVSISTQSSAESIILSERDTSESMCDGDGDGEGDGDEYPTSEYCSSEKSSSSSNGYKTMTINKIQKNHLKPLSRSRSRSRPPAIDISVSCVPVPAEDIYAITSSRTNLGDFQGVKAVEMTIDSPTHVQDRDRIDRERNRERDMVREGYSIPFSRSHSIGNSSEGGSERGYDYYKYGDVTDDDFSPSESEG